MKPTITLEYCPKCNWLLRSAWMAQELLTTFADELHGVLLHPSDTSGRFTVWVDGRELFDRKAAGRFPDIKELKQLVRDAVAPGKSLGHSDRPA
ncbi:SelT/SelW/SelH family protein [Hymenobacter sp. RP-2-7]|uniref:SelT/SelW/SelH family protein n=1 Tax=Hymenobacter polaris TaxID=2682546 RepID=A0A7Y0ADC8_9BACT|nr:SelT/SelW/SelH family protein [Hymenobacter polaris]NML65015.1 SelT/SelW/SelH family protein [Hymenobacter polaris]